jgi:hypothetical protein
MSSLAHLPFSADDVFVVQNQAPQVKFLLTVTRLREMIALESEKWTHTI